MRKKEEEQYLKNLRCIGFILLGGVISLLFCTVLVFVCSFWISNGLLSDKYMLQYTVAICTLGSFAGSSFAVRRCGEKILIVGAGSGIVLFLLLLSIGFLVFTGSTIENHGVLLILGCMIGGTMAGILGGKRKKKRRK